MTIVDRIFAEPGVPAAGPELRPALDATRKALHQRKLELDAEIDELFLSA